MKLLGLKLLQLSCARSHGVMVSTLDFESSDLSSNLSGTRVPFLERPDNLTGPKSDFEIKISRKVGYVLNSNKVHFVSLANNLTV